MQLPSAMITCLLAFLFAMGTGHPLSSISNIVDSATGSPDTVSKPLSGLTSISSPSDAAAVLSDSTSIIASVTVPTFGPHPDVIRRSGKILAPMPRSLASNTTKESGQGLRNITTSKEWRDEDNIECTNTDIAKSPGILLKDIWHDLGRAIAQAKYDCMVYQPLIPAHSWTNWVYGGAQLYMCNQKNEDIFCNGDPSGTDSAMRDIDGKCGTSGSGNYHFHDPEHLWENLPSFLIGRDSAWEAGSWKPKNPC